jgi:hypothetical protein
MGKQWLTGLVAIVAVVAVGGIGFAAFTTTAYINGSANAGTVQLAWWDGTQMTTPSASYVTCSATVSTTTMPNDTLTVGASNLAPGDNCTVSVTLANEGSLPATVYDYLTAATGSCSWYYIDNFAPGGHSSATLPETPQGPIALGANSQMTYTAFLGLYSGQGNSCQGADLSFSLNVTGTAS